LLIWILRIISYIILSYLLYFSQEMSRYLLGRSIGIPADKIKIEMFSFPQRVAIFDGESWVFSDEERFLTAYSRYDPLWQNGFLYACSGLYGESVLVVAMGIIFSLGGWREVALAVVIISLFLNLGQMVYSLYLSWSRDEVRGDYTSIYVLDPGRGTGYVLVHFLIRVVLLVLL